jgi:hypothetical protein
LVGGSPAATLIAFLWLCTGGATQETKLLAANVGTIGGQGGQIAALTADSTCSYEDMRRQLMVNGEEQGASER